MSRMAHMADVSRDALFIQHHRCRHRRSVALSTEAAARSGLKEVVRAESWCCAFLDFTVTEAPTALVLHINGPGGTESIRDPGGSGLLVSPATRRVGYVGEAHACQATREAWADGARVESPWDVGHAVPKA